MQIEATWSGITLATFTGGDVVNDFRLNGVDLAQALPGLRKAAAGLVHRRNTTHTLAFVCKRPPFSTPAAAAQFQADHAIAFAAISAAATLEFSIADKDYELADAVVTRREPVEHYGTTVAYAYQITGGALTDVTP